MNNIMLAGYLKKQVQKYEGGVDLESNKSVSITSNGTTIVQPTSGKDGMEQVTVTTNVPTSSSDLESNHAETIDVSEYTEPVEITPTEGKDGMKKATVTLSNIPSGDSATLYAWGVTIDDVTHYCYTDFNIAPESLIECEEKMLLDVDDNYNLSKSSFYQSGGGGVAPIFTRTSDTVFSIASRTYTYDSTKNISIW